MPPPKDVEPRDLFRKLLERPRPNEVVELPVHWTSSGFPPKVRIIIVRDIEYDNARWYAREKMRERYKASGDQLDAAGKRIEADWVARYLMAEAVHYVEPIDGTETLDAGPQYSKVFPDPETVAQALHRDELDVLGSMYSTIQSKYGPIATVDSEEERTQWIAAIAEGGDSVPLSRLPSLESAALLQSASERVYVLSAILASLRESWQPSWESLFTTWGITTGSFGRGAANSIAARCSPSPGDDALLAYDEDERAEGAWREIAEREGVKAAEPLTAENAARLAREMARIVEEPEEG